MNELAFKTRISSTGLDQLSEIQKKNAGDPGNKSSSASSEGKSFFDHLKQGISEVNESHRVADKLAAEVASGKDENLHEAMLAMTQTELSFNFMVQVRNKALEAYQEIMRMPL